MATDTPEPDPTDELPPITPDLRAELERRIALTDADPGRGIPWEEVRAAARARSAVRGKKAED